MIRMLKQLSPTTVLVLTLVGILPGLMLHPVEAGEKTATKKPIRLLLLWHSPDGHPRSTHEYHAGMQIIAQHLARHTDIQTLLVHANDPWPEGPQLLDSADAAALFVSEGAKWVSNDPKRLAAFQRLAARGGGLTGLHWGIGTRKAKPIPAFLSLLGGCHGGPDRKYTIVTARVSPTHNSKQTHPVLNGIQPFEVKDEFYYKLKFVAGASPVTPLLQVPINGIPETVSWAWQRPDQGRSFGFSGLHFHKNWKTLEYRRLVVQGILWTLKKPIPQKGIPVINPPALPPTVIPKEVKKRKDQNGLSPARK